MRVFLGYTLLGGLFLSPAIYSLIKSNNRFETLKEWVLIYFLSALCIFIVIIGVYLIS